MRGHWRDPEAERWGARLDEARARIEASDAGPMHAPVLLLRGGRGRLLSVPYAHLPWVLRAVEGGSR